MGSKASVHPAFAVKAAISALLGITATLIPPLVRIHHKNTAAGGKSRRFHEHDHSESFPPNVHSTFVCGSTYKTRPTSEQNISQFPTWLLPQVAAPLRDGLGRWPLLHHLLSRETDTSVRFAWKRRMRTSFPLQQPPNEPVSHSEEQQLREDTAAGVWVGVMGVMGVSVCVWGQVDVNAAAHFCIAGWPEAPWGGLLLPSKVNSTWNERTGRRKV